MINCALVTDDETFRRHVRNLVQSPQSSARLVLELQESASRLARDKVANILAADPQLVFIDLGDSTMGLRVLEVLSQEAPEVAIIAAGPGLPAESLLRVIRAGASEYLPRPFVAEDTDQAFNRVRRRLGNVRPEEQNARGEVTTLFSPKGGVGVTTMAANLAVALNEASGEDTVLLDLAPSLGTAALILGIQPRYSYLDVIQNFHRLDDELFQSFLETHESGLRVLASPPRSDDPDGPSMDEVMGLLRFCRRHFAHVVVDAGHTLTDAAEVALMEGDNRFWVTTPELPTLRNIKRTLEIIGDQSANGKEPFRVILNHYAEGLGVTSDEVETAIGLEVEAVFQEEPALIAESINLGRPAVHMGKSSFQRTMTELAATIAGQSPVPLRRTGFINALLRPFRSGTASANGTGATDPVIELKEAS